MGKRKNFFEIGYKESIKKPKLFYKHFGRVILFIDVRDLFFKTFYFQPQTGLTSEEKEEYTSRIIEEFNLANKSKIGEPLDFYSLSYCMGCGKEYLFDDYEYRDCGICSKGCLTLLKKEFAKEDKKEVEMWKNAKCKICKKLPELVDKHFPIFYVDKRHNHHLDYREGKEKTIPVCSSCHAKITHHPDKYPELKKYEPMGSRKEMLGRKKKEKKFCVLCKEELTGRQLKYCLKCKKKKEDEDKRKRNIRKNKYRWSPDRKVGSSSPMLRAWEE